MSAPRQRRVWNWGWRFKRFRKDLARRAAGFSMFLLLVVASIMGMFAWLSFYIRRRLLGLRPKDPRSHPRTIAMLPAHGATGRPRKHVLLLDNGRRSATLVDPLRGYPNADSQGPERKLDLSRQDRQAIEETANAAVQANLSFCLSPTAAIAVADDAHQRSQLYWDGLESVLARLVQLITNEDDIRALMELCNFEWLYEMPVSVRVIRLIEDPGTGAMRWRHNAVHLIEFEFSGTQHEARILPPRQLHLSCTQIQTFFDKGGRFVHWKRKFVPYRRSSF